MTFCTVIQLLVVSKGNRKSTLITVTAIFLGEVHELDLCEVVQHVLIVRYRLCFDVRRVELL